MVLDMWDGNNGNSNMRCYESSMASRDEIASLAERIDLSLELSRYTHVIHINRFIACFVFV